MDVLDKIKHDNSVRIGFSFVLVVLLFLCIQWTGWLPVICENVDIMGKAIAGYKSREYVVGTTNRTPIAMLQGIYIEQEIFLEEDVLENDEIMLEIDVANYERINEGQLCLEIYQDDVKKVFVSNMADIKEDKTLRLIVDTKRWTEGNVYVNIYCPTGTGDNCIAVYAVTNTKVYSELNVSGEITNQNACIDLVIPSDFAKSDFVQVDVE